jgi:hypothetical protein
VRRRGHGLSRRGRQRFSDVDDGVLEARDLDDDNDGLADGPDADDDNDGVSDNQEAKANAKHKPKKLDKKHHH